MDKHGCVEERLRQTGEDWLMGWRDRAWRDVNTTGGTDRGTRSWFIFAPLLGYLVGTLLDERGELGHHHVHALQTGRFQFEDLLFHHGLEGQVRGEQPRSESAFGKVKRRPRRIAGEGAKPRTRKEKEKKQQKEEKKRIGLVIKNH